LAVVFNQYQEVIKFVGEVARSEVAAALSPTSGIACSKVLCLLFRLYEQARNNNWLANLGIGFY